MTSAPLALETLTEGGQRPEDVGARLADWISRTQRTLDLALYSVHVPGAVGDRVMAAVRDASARGVAVRALRAPPRPRRRRRCTRRRCRACAWTSCAAPACTSS